MPDSVLIRRKTIHPEPDGCEIPPEAPCRVGSEQLDRTGARERRSRGRATEPSARRVVSRHAECPAPAISSPEQRILAALAAGPSHLEQLRAAVAARKQSVTRALHALEETGHVVRHTHGWQLRQD